MEETRFLVCDSYQRVKIGTDVSLIHKFAVVLDGSIVGVYDDMYDDFYDDLLININNAEALISEVLIISLYSSLLL